MAFEGRLKSDTDTSYDSTGIEAALRMPAGVSTGGEREKETAPEYQGLARDKGRGKGELRCPVPFSGDEGPGTSSCGRIKIVCSFSYIDVGVLLGVVALRSEVSDRRRGYHFEELLPQGEGNILRNLPSSFVVIAYRVAWVCT
ncbi:hypothetical protein NDU88_009711 [Pleurodeles waltl]|uniref:Uncharacterized protein n=1 Tax=Pleurodeles waltl TaxID=8319 RepID=A0AAV7PWQ8_PLEWA|nr:hypothetical protein NDU88_009711 [Pleurodeles waltl]